jgi:hypothetical protein
LLPQSPLIILYDAQSPQATSQPCDFPWSFTDWRLESVDIRRLAAMVGLGERRGLGTRTARLKPCLISN